ncbi:SRPBCC family protein [Nocardioides pantholopis]|uniref:SRPBCC family protein n=1 Tax=Nocardioides pantholopis TaxID=2483798 RepID=UPI000F0893E1|nr:SRPBCC family protein [Nocardioides pantholopis]
MGPTLRIDVAAPHDVAWRELVDVRCWPHWGPTVRAARLDDGTAWLSAGATGAVQTPFGVWLPFRVEHWHDDGPRHAWSWRVAGVPATEHAVTRTGPDACRVEMAVPWWAPAYLGVVRLALTRIRRRAESSL